MYYSYVEIEYIATSFTPARTDLALKLLTIDLNMMKCVGITGDMLQRAFVMQGAMCLVG
jgi:hypothetical protein